MIDNGIKEGKEGFWCSLADILSIFWDIFPLSPHYQDQYTSKYWFGRGQYQYVSTLSTDILNHGASQFLCSCSLNDIKSFL